MLAEIIPLLPILSSNNLIRSLLTISRQLTSDNNDIETDYATTWANKTFVFGQLIRIPLTSKRMALLPDFDVVKLATLALKKWWWSEYVLEGITELVKSWYVI